MATTKKHHFDHDYRRWVLDVLFVLFLFFVFFVLVSARPNVLPAVAIGPDSEGIGQNTEEESKSFDLEADLAKLLKNPNVNLLVAYNEHGIDIEIVSPQEARITEIRALGQRIETMVEEIRKGRAYPEGDYESLRTARGRTAMVVEDTLP
jgi:hypothetical protein